MALLHCISPYTAILLLLLLTYRLIFILMSTAYGVLHALVVGVCKGVVGGLPGLCLMLLAAFFKTTTCQFSFSSPPNV